ncbi:MAG: hypothetical protein ACOYJY_04605 [Acutalibacteraceae bacterium]|jgi:hypothetical protein
MPYKTAAHRKASQMRGIFGATDAALLAQGKDNKPESTAFGRLSGALSLSRVSLCPLATTTIPTGGKTNGEA